MRIQAPGIANSANQPMPFGRWSLRVVRELVREDDLLLVLRERREEHRVPEDDPPRRPDPEGVGVRLVGVLADLLDPKRNVPEAELRLVRARRLEERLVAERLRREVEVGSDEREDRSDGDEDRCPRQPPTVTEAARESHDDEERDADREELGGQRRPVLEDPVEVAQVALAPASLPPVGGDRERKVHEPGDAKTEHPEEHPRADRPRRRLPHESRAAAGVDPQRREQRDLREHPVDGEEPVVALRPLDEVGPEDRVDVDRAQAQVVRDGGRVEEECAEREPAHDHHREGGSQNASPTAGVGTAALSSGSGWASRRIGAPYG